MPLNDYARNMIAKVKERTDDSRLDGYKEDPIAKFNEMIASIFLEIEAMSTQRGLKIILEYTDWLENKRSRLIKENLSNSSEDMLRNMMLFYGMTLEYKETEHITKEIDQWYVADLETFAELMSSQLQVSPPLRFVNAESHVRIHKELNGKIISASSALITSCCPIFHDIVGIAKIHDEKIRYSESLRDSLKVY